MDSQMRYSILIVLLFVSFGFSQGAISPAFSWPALISDDFIDNSISINQAIARANESILILPKGRYYIYGMIDISNSNVRTIKGDSTTLIIGGNYRDRHVFKMGNHSRTTISGFVVDGCNETDINGNFISAMSTGNGTDMILENCHFINFTGHGVAGSGDRQIIRNNTFDNFGRNIIQITTGADPSDVRIQNNNLFNAHDGLIEIDNGYGDRIFITDNIGIGYGDIGIQVENGSDNCIISRNYIFNFDNPGKQIVGHSAFYIGDNSDKLDARVILNENWIWGANIGLHIQNANFVTGSNNQFHKIYGSAIHVNDNSDYLVLNGNIVNDPYQAYVEGDILGSLNELIFVPGNIHLADYKLINGKAFHIITGPGSNQDSKRISFVQARDSCNQDTVFLSQAFSTQPDSESKFAIFSSIDRNVVNINLNSQYGSISGLVIHGRQGRYTNPVIRRAIEANGADFWKFSGVICDTQQVNSIIRWGDNFQEYGLQAQGSGTISAGQNSVTLTVTGLRYYMPVFLDIPLLYDIPNDNELRVKTIDGQATQQNINFNFQVGQ